MTNDDVIYRSRLRLFAVAREFGSVRRACRLLGVHASTYYRWRRELLRYGPEVLRPRERRPARLANASSPMVEQRVVAFALGQPGLGPARIAAELGRERWGGLRVSNNGVWRVLRRHGLNTRAKRLGLLAGYAAPRQELLSEPPAERHIQATHPGHRVQLDCFCIGRLSGSQGTTWQYTATDVVSAYTWASCTRARATPRPAGPPSWRAGWPASWRRGDGAWRR